MLHLTFVNNEAEPLAVVGYTGCNLKTGYQPFDDWFKERRMDCMDVREREEHSRHRVQAITRLHALGEDGVRSHVNGGVGHSPQEREREVERRLAVFNGCRLDNLLKGSQNAAIALSYPEMDARNRCLICVSTSRWRMYQEDPIEEAMKKEVGRKWEIKEGKEIQCAEVETEIQIQRLKDQAASHGESSRRSDPLDLVSRPVVTKQSIKDGGRRGREEGGYIYGRRCQVAVKAS